MEFRSPQYAAILPASSTFRYVFNHHQQAAAAFHRPFPFLCSSSSSSSIAETQPTLVANRYDETQSKQRQSQAAAEEKEEAMLEALRMWRTTAALAKFEELQELSTFPDRECTSRLIAQLCHQGTVSSISKAQQIMLEVEKGNRVAELVDCDAIGLLVMATARTGTPRYSLRILRLMFELEYFPHVKIWSAVVSRLGKSLDDAQLAVEVFDEVCHIVAEKGFEQLQKQMKSGALQEIGDKVTFDERTETNAGVDETVTEETDEKVVKSTIPLEKMNGSTSIDQSNRAKEPQVSIDPAETRKPKVKKIDIEKEAIVSADYNKEADKQAQKLADYNKEADKQAQKLVEIARMLTDKAASTSAVEASVTTAESRQALLRMKPDTGAFNAVLNACANIGAFGKAEQLWELMEAFRVAPNTLTFNIMIKLYARTEKLNSLLQILQTMDEAGVNPDITTLNSLVAAFVGLGELNQAEYIVQILRGDLKPGKDDGNNLKLLHKQKFQPDVRMYTTLMKGYVQQNRVSDAMQLLVAMQEEAKATALPNEFTFTTAIRACAKMGLIKEARVILQEMSRQGVAANVFTYNTLLQGVCAFPDMNQAAEIVEDMKVSGVALDVVSYNTLINGHLEAGDNVEALAVFTRMRQAKIAASKVTYGTLMKGFGRSGHTELVAKVFTEMAKDPRVRIDVVAWNTLIDAYAKAGLEQDAVRTLQEMKDRGFHPTSATYCTLVKAFGKSRNHGQLILLWNEIKRRSVDEDNAAVRNEPVVVGALKPDAALLDSLIDAFVRGGYFQLALQVVDCMDRQGIRTGRAKAKYKRLYVELYANLYTSKHTSQRQKAKTAERRRGVEAFKFWVGLPNDSIT